MPASTRSPSSSTCAKANFVKDFPRTFRKLQAMPGLSPTLIFLEASHQALVRRFSETRRPHPLAPDRSATEGITEERGKLNTIRALADLILDTTNLTVHELRDIFMRMSRDTQRARGDDRQPGELRLSSTGCRWTPTWCSTSAVCRIRTSSTSCAI